MCEYVVVVRWGTGEVKQLGYHEEMELRLEGGEGYAVMCGQPHYLDPW